MILSDKEISRADNGYTAVVRPNREKGGWNVAIVSIKTGRPVFKFHHVLSKKDMVAELASDLRMMNKCGFDCKMADASRHRYLKE